MSEQPDSPVIEYVKPSDSPAKDGQFALNVATVLTTAILCLAILPLPRGEYDWHLGHRPQWLISIDSGGLSVGRTGDQNISIPVEALIFLKLLLVSFSAWLIRRIFQMRHRPQP